MGDAHQEQHCSPPLQTLAREISSAAGTISSFLQQHASSQCPDRILAGSFAIPHDAPAEVAKARRELFEATCSIQQLLMSPTDFNIHATLNLQQLVSYRWLLNFDIPDHIPLETAVSYASVAEAAHVSEDQLTRFARLAMTGGLFHEPIVGQIAHTPVSAGLRRPAPVRDTMLFMTDTMLPTATKAVEMTRSQILHATQTDSAIDAQVGIPRTAFQLAHDTSLSFYQYLSSHPQIASRLAAGMRTISAASESHVSHLHASYHWTELPTGTTILDLGGSRGHISLALAASYPQLKFIVQDLPPVIAEASAQSLDPAVRGRVTFHAHNFLEPQPAELQASVDIYLFRQCFNNWPYHDASRILRALLPCLEGEHKRLLLNNIVVPVPFSTPLQRTGKKENGGEDEIVVYGRGMREEAITRTRDSAMLQLMDGAERDLCQWQSLLREADERLEIVSIVKPEGSLLSLLEVKLRADKGP